MNTEELLRRYGWNADSAYLDTQSKGGTQADCVRAAITAFLEEAQGEIQADALALTELSIRDARLLDANTGRRLLVPSHRSATTARKGVVVTGPMRPGDPVPNDFGPWCACGEFRTRSAAVAKRPVCADDERLASKAAVAAIGRTRFASVFNRKGEREVA